MPGVLAGASLGITLTLGTYITPLLIAGPLQPLFAIGIDSTRRSTPFSG